MSSAYINGQWVLMGPCVSAKTTSDVVRATTEPVAAAPVHERGWAGPWAGAGVIHTQGQGGGPLKTD